MSAHSRTRPTPRSSEDAQRRTSQRNSQRTSQRTSPSAAKEFDTSAAVTDLGKLALLQLASRQPGIPHSEETQAAVLALGARAISQSRSTSQINERIVSPARGIARLEAPGRTETQARGEINRQLNRGATPQPIGKGPDHETVIRAANSRTTTEADPQIRRGSTQPRSAASPLAGARDVAPASGAAAAGPRKEVTQSEGKSDSTIKDDPYRHALQTELTRTRKRVKQFERGLSIPSSDKSLEALIHRVVDYRNKPLQECQGKLAKTFKRIFNMEMRLQHIRDGATEPVAHPRWQPSYIHEIQTVLAKHLENPEACLSRLRQKLRRRVGEESDHPQAGSDIWLYVRVIRERISNTKDLEHYLATCLQPMAGHGEGRQAPDRPLLTPTQQNERGGAAGGRAAHTPDVGPIDNSVAYWLTRDMEEVPRPQSRDGDNRVADDRPADKNPAAGPLARQRSHQPPALDNRQSNPSPAQASGQELPSGQAINARASVASVLRATGQSTGSLPSSTGGPPYGGPLAGGPSGASAGGPAGVQIGDYCSRARGWKYRPGAPRAGGISPAGSAPPAANIARPAGTRPTGSVDSTRNIRPASRNRTVSDIAGGDPLISGETMHDRSRHVRARRDGAATAAATATATATGAAGVAAAVPPATSCVAAAAPAPAIPTSSKSPAQSHRPTSRRRKRKAPERVIK